MVGDGTIPSDDYGHGTHVAGIIAGNGSDSSGKRTGIAPGAHLIVYKVLDGSGHGRISDVIAALDDIVANKDSLNIRVVNLSVATGVYESYLLDPLTLAAQRAVLAYQPMQHHGFEVVTPRLLEDANAALALPASWRADETRARAARSTGERRAARSARTRPARRRSSTARRPRPMHAPAQMPGA